MTANRTEEQFTAVIGEHCHYHYSGDSIDFETASKRIIPESIVSFLFFFIRN